MTHSTTDRIRQVMDRADCLTEVYEALINQRYFVSVLYIEIGGKSFYQFFAVDFGVYVLLEEIDGDLMQQSKVLAYQEIPADYPNVEKDLKSLIQAATEAVITF